MAIQQSYTGEVTVAFRYRASAASDFVNYDIPTERISYVMIEHLYENQNILPVIYLSINLTADIYGLVMNTSDTSKFYLKIIKKDMLSKTAVQKKVVEDVFSYVTSTFNANYAQGFDHQSGDAYKSITIGLVSSAMTNTLRTPFNGVYNNIDTAGLVQMALDGMGKVVQAPLVNVFPHKEFMIPPMSSRYQLLQYVFDLEPFYNSYFTFYMDFDKSYLIPKNGNPVSDGGIDSVIINVKDYSSADAYIDGFTVENGAYVVYVNSIDTKMIVNNMTSKVTNNIIGYYDAYEDPRNFRVDSEDVIDNTTKTSYTRTRYAGLDKTELESNSIIIELMKQNLDSDIFTPNRAFNVNNYGDYVKYNGKYFISYKREIYSINTGRRFNILCTVGLKKAGTEETPLAKTNALPKRSTAVSSSGTRTTTAATSSNTSSKPRVTAAKTTAKSTRSTAR